MTKNEKIKQTFGERLRYHRETLNLSRTALSHKLDVSAKTIQSWENGRTFPENLDLLVSIEKNLQCSVTAMLRAAIDRKG